MSDVLPKRIHLYVCVTMMRKTQGTSNRNLIVLPWHKVHGFNVFLMSLHAARRIQFRAYKVFVGKKHEINKILHPSWEQSAFLFLFWPMTSPEKQRGLR